MDEHEGGRFSDVGDPSEQFHRNEAISAVADDGFLGEEEDDYEDLYNDVNIGEGFLQSVRKNEEEFEKKPEPLPPQTLAESVSLIPGVSGGVGGDVAVDSKFEKDVGGSDGGGSTVSGRVGGFQNMGFSDNEMAVRGSGGLSLPPGGVGMGVELGQSSNKVAELEKQAVSNNVLNQGMRQPPHAAGVGAVGNTGNEGFAKQGRGIVNGSANTFGNGNGNVNGVGSGAGSVGGYGGGGGGGGTILFVGDLHWWTTDAELEAELCKYGPVKEVKFFDEKASGKSKGYCQVEFFDSAAAEACKERMNGHMFNGRPCVVASASPYSIKRMGEAQINRSQQMAQPAPTQARRAGVDAVSKTGGSNTATSGNYPGTSDNSRGYRGPWVRGNAPGMGNRGPTAPGRNRPGGGRGINIGNGFGPGMGATPPLLHPQTMMGQGFDPAFGAPMARMPNFGGFPGAPPFSGVLTSFPPVGSVGLPGVAPHVNPAFFGRNLPMNGMGMMPTTGVEGHNMGMWSDPNMGGWTGEEHAGRAGESSYGEEAMSDHHYGEVSHDRGGWPNAMKEKDRGSEMDWSGSSDRRYRDDREPGYDRDVPREKDKGQTQNQDWSERKNRDDRDLGRDRDRERDFDRERSRDRERDRDRDRERDRDVDRQRDDRDRYVDHHRYRDREPEYDDERDRGRSSRPNSKSRVPQDEEQRSRSRDAEYGKRRRLTSTHEKS